MKMENPAVRLQRVLAKIHSTRNDTPCKSAWHAAFDIANDEDGYLLQKLGEFMMMPMEAAQTMNSQFPALKEQTDAWLQQISYAFKTQNLSGHIHSFQANYTAKEGKFLDVMSEMIKIKSFDELDESLIASAKEKLQELANEVLDSKLEQKLKEYIIKAIRRIIVALEEYQLMGSVPVVESIELMMGRSFTDENFRASLATPIGAKIFNVVGAVANMVTIATGMPATDWNKISETIAAKLPLFIEK